jgi:hypothetical protein
MRKYIYKKHYRYDGSYQLERWATNNGIQYYKDSEIFETDTDYCNYLAEGNETTDIAYTDADLAADNEKIRQQRQSRYQTEIDPMTLDYISGGMTDTQLLARLVAAKKAIKEALPYYE